MLVLSRQRDEVILIGDDVEVVVVDVRGDKVRLGVTAPKEVGVHRKEVYEEIRRRQGLSKGVSVAGLGLGPQRAEVLTKTDVDKLLREAGYQLKLTGEIGQDETLLVWANGKGEEVIVRLRGSALQSVFREATPQELSGAGPVGR